MRELSTARDTQEVWRARFLSYLTEAETEQLLADIARRAEVLPFSFDELAMAAFNLMRVTPSFK